MQKAVCAAMQTYGSFVTGGIVGLKVGFGARKFKPRNAPPIRSIGISRKFIGATGV